MKIYVLVSETQSSNRSLKQQLDHVWVGSGSLRISPAHLNRKCPHTRRADRNRARSQIVEIPAEWLEHPLFRGLRICQQCGAAQERVQVEARRGLTGEGE